MAADPTLADRIDTFRRGCEAHPDVEVDPEFSELMIDTAAALRKADAAAVRLRKLDAAIESAVREIRGTHYQDPLIRTLCVVCGAADGSYPCSALVEADALANALGDTE